ncbi:stage V sporulation protein S [Desulfofundulus australicus DSM 11792]|uniref:Stage V sporulation protein S n=1 Tax=Desulfofundulus australicus DSM 11792 TaxID=1121425 RepID=A0A1M5CC77_9FIRM|nr:stage V sporulation protein S [Desulfofundulus australicus]SHF52276.1 stage V sporulation protein S [Desulfofundulus australicus DSM 11792]
MELFKVSSRTDARELGKALYTVLKKSGGQVLLQAIGAGAVHQAIKGIAIARGLAAPEGAEIKTVPGFTQVMMDGTVKTMLQFRVFWR